MAGGPAKVGAPLPSPHSSLTCTGEPQPAAAALAPSCPLQTGVPPPGPGQHPPAGGGEPPPEAGRGEGEDLQGPRVGRAEGGQAQWGRLGLGQTETVSALLPLPSGDQQTFQEETDREPPATLQRWGGLRATKIKKN